MTASNQIKPPGRATRGRRRTETRGALVQTHDTDARMARYDDIPTELAEAIRSVLNRNELRAGSLPKAIVVASAVKGEGVTTVSQALATILAQETGQFVCWVDCSWLADDAGTPSPDRPNLIDMLADNSRLGGAFQASPELPSLVSLSPGPVPAADRNKIARSPEFEDLLEVLRLEFDHVIFDVPPLLAYANSLAIVRLADASLLVVRHRVSSRSQIRRAVEAMEPTSNIGVILNQYRTRIPSGIRRLLGE